ncbi:hypothetical protein OG607_25355 [Streptomyces sp. NBC_01537]|uniref:hypothetical protein n=1 Tax=Streptomyces sp. NBC_01537 TaxID=2903896 RepID=UPI003868831F
MPFFARASWPGDHRDEIVAGALVALVVVVLGYASGIGAPAAGVQLAAPPASAAPQPTAEPGSAPPPDISATGPATGPGDGGGTEGAGMLPVADQSESGLGSLPGGGSGTDGGTGGTGGAGTGGGAGSSPTPGPSGSADPSPSASQPCSDGQVHLVQPLLEGVTKPVTDLLDGLLGTGATASPSATPSPAATSRSVCLGILASPTASAQATP